VPKTAPGLHRLNSRGWFIELPGMLTDRQVVQPNTSGVCWALPSLCVFPSFSFLSCSTLLDPSYSWKKLTILVDKYVVRCSPIHQFMMFCPYQLSYVHHKFSIIFPIHWQLGWSFSGPATPIPLPALRNFYVTLMCWKLLDTYDTYDFLAGINEYQWPQDRYVRCVYRYVRCI
jgi:hypothetical protein